jgi:hypothetical protein
LKKDFQTFLILVENCKMQGCPPLGDLINVDGLLLEEEGEDFRQVVLDCQLERRVVVDGEDSGIGSFDDEKGDDIVITEVDCPMERIPPTISSFIEQILEFLAIQSIQVILVLVLGQFVYNSCHGLQASISDCLQHAAETFLKVG